MLTALRRRLGKLKEIHVSVPAGKQGPASSLINSLPLPVDRGNVNPSRRIQ